MIGPAAPVVRVETSNATGSGFFVAPDTLLTNAHVVGGNSSVTIRRSGGTTSTARVTATSLNFDVAVLKISDPAPGQATLLLGSALTVRPGQEVIAIGSALGMLQNTVTRGIVSALRQVGPGNARADRRGAQPRQQRRPAARSQRCGHRDQHRQLPQQSGAELRGGHRPRAGRARGTDSGVDRDDDGAAVGRRVAGALARAAVGIRAAAHRGPARL